MYGYAVELNKTQNPQLRNIRKMAWMVASKKEDTLTKDLFRGLEIEGSLYSYEGDDAEKQVAADAILTEKKFSTDEIKALHTFYVQDLFGNSGHMLCSAADKAHLSFR